MNDKITSNIKITKFRPDADIKNGCVLAVGSFDGVHIGHREMLSALRGESKKKNLPSVIFTFEPEDSPKGEIKLLATEMQKNSLLSALGIDILVSAPFSVIRDISAGKFTEDILYGVLGAKSVICGYDFCFGKGRKGNAELVNRLLSPKGVNVVTPPAVCDEGVAVSSTRIRNLISEGAVSKAALLLGRRFSFSAPVIHGARLGRKLGFPTINQEYPSCLVTPKFGVYAVVCSIDGKTYGGVANVGIKPTVDYKDAPLCETHLFDYNGECYEKTAETEFIAFIRPEQKFESIADLTARVERDIISAKEILNKEFY